MAIIKASDRHRDIQRRAFSFEDLSQRAEAYLNRVRQQAARIVRQAHDEAQAIRQRIEAEARQEAERSIHARAEQLAAAYVEQQWQTLGPALREAVEQLRYARHAFLNRWERQAVQLAAAIAQRVVRRELQQQPDIPLQLLREALELAADAPRVRIRLHPTDHASLGPTAEQLAAQLGRFVQADVVADPAVQPGGCVLDLPQGSIDQQIESQLARIVDELS
jgi:flagellar assembly protein FliH